MLGRLFSLTRFVAQTLPAPGWKNVHILEVGRVWTPGSTGVSSSETPLS